MTVTVVIPISPSPAHPCADILISTVESVRYHLPDAPIFLTFDGVRPEQEHLLERYSRHIDRVGWLCDNDPMFESVSMFLFDEHTHQVGMMRGVIDEIDTPLLMYVEHDMPIRIGRPIDFDAITGFILSDRSDMVRLYLRENIPEDHDHLMHGRDDSDSRFLRTSQWSQNVHVATVAIYRQLLDDHFSPDAKCFIEDRVHGAASETCPEKFRLHIYHPEDDVKFLLHLDGRRGESKFEMDQVF